MVERVSVINQIISKYKLNNPDYLEIGVQHGVTFNLVNSINKDGVDPCIYGAYNFINYKMCSDDFFSKHITKKYDIIFIDGLHTAYQVTKDIYNSINNLKSGGFIILDDVYPHNENEQFSVKLFYDGPQTGDVWKGVYNILDKLEDISDEIFFIKNTMRGNIILKIKENNKDNIVIDTTLPICNTYGLCRCGNCEWNKYNYKLDFNTYFSKISKFKDSI
jgi:hypothetical protein